MTFRLPPLRQCRSSLCSLDNKSSLGTVLAPALQWRTRWTCRLPSRSLYSRKIAKMNNQDHFRVTSAAASRGQSSHCGAGVGGWQGEGRPRFRRGGCGRLFCREVRASEASGRSSQLSEHLGVGVSGNGTQGAHRL